MFINIVFFISNMKIRCLFGFHKWEKFCGPRNMGDGKFEQKLICVHCKKVKYYVS
jgi:hypothetical protein